MTSKKIQTVCGYSCSDCSYLGKECPGCEATKGKPFWTELAGTTVCPVYDCCVNERKFPHCGKCPDLVCERFTRFRDPNVTDDQIKTGLAAMEKELRSRK